MPADRNSTKRRRDLIFTIENYGAIMVSKCSFCKAHSRVCKVHISSGKCSECWKQGSKCDVAVTRNEFSRLVSEKKKLEAQMLEARKEQDAAFEALRVARAKEERLSKQLAQNEKRAGEVIAVESAALMELEEDPVQPAWPAGPAELSTSVWSAMNDLPPEFWDNSVTLPS
ncbi:hypothetical protein PMIN01_12119 [Paraphaeosphaeria minitans]|uniref:Zn(2)-C6 fungal-type domain-containing protein n=1 Tax=Paraphaeosphaeria minitans TaxID=565426 RepID=A0A9P6G7S8_9PLEO|nr:hypothetical protein PMIN01_12119 [Paraphaeosphaeria minitans]